MEFELISGGFGTGVHETVKERIEALTKEKKSSVLIVPEQFSVSMEKELYRALAPDAPLYFEVSNFTRLANTAHRALGGLTSTHTDRARRALTMWQCLTELSPALKTFGRSKDISAAEVNRAISAINELSSYGISSEALDDAMNTLSEKNPRLSDKLSDISLISALYKKLLRDKYSDTGDELEILASLLSEHPEYLSGTDIFIEGFTSFTEPQYKIIEILMKRSKLSIALTLSKHSNGSFEFFETETARAKLVRLAARAGVQTKERVLVSQRETKSTLLFECVNLLFKGYGEIDRDSLNERDALRIFEASDPYEECAFIAEDIKRRVMSGEKYSDFAIVARNADTYIGTLDDALMKAKIPHFISHSKDILSFEATKLIFSALEIISSGFSREDVISFLKSGFSGISREACDKFDIYTDMWQLSGALLASKKDFTLSPYGYKARGIEDSDELLIEINKTHSAINALFDEFKEEMSRAATIKDFATALVNFSTKLSLEEKIADRSRELLSLGESEAAEECAALWQAILNSLDILVFASGDSPCDIESFKSRLELVLAENSIGRIPSYRDTVTIGSADILRLSGKRHVYMIGVNLGEFPMTPTDTGLFQDREKRELSSLGIELDDDTEKLFYRELFYFARSFASAKESVTLLYTDTDFSYKAKKPGELIARIKEISGGSITPCKISSLNLADIIYSEGGALSLANKTGNPHLLSALSELGYEKELKYSASEITNSDMFLSEDMANLIYGTEISLTQARIDRFIDCPLAYFCEYKLKLAENERAEFDSRSIGSFIHAILENFFANAKKEGRDASLLSYEEKAEIAKKAAWEYLKSINQDALGKARLSASIERLKSSAIPIIDELCDELSSCEFKPAFFELSIGGDEDSPSAPCFPTEGGAVKIYGSIDRVDTYKSGDDVYVRVLDYKTGSKSFSPSDLDEGRNMQMFLYLLALVNSENEAFLSKVGVGEGGRLIPAGVIYIKTNMNDVRIEHQDEAEALRAVKKNQKREGMLLDDEISLSAQNKNFIPISFKKDGSPTAASEKLLYKADEWGKITEKLSSAIKSVYDGMRQGNVSAVPMKNKKTSPCAYCKFKPVCRNASIKD